MRDSPKLMCILAHPDDESLGTGGILAKYAAEGVKTYLVTATNGEHGWFGPKEAYPGPKALGQRRREEVSAAAEVLGIEEITYLGYEDGKLDEADAREVISKIVAEVRGVRPDVVVTFDPYGSYGHPDHIAICQFTTAALVAAADPNFETAGNRPAHQVPKLYYIARTQENYNAYQEAFGDLVMEVDGQIRQPVSWEPWAITTRVDTTAHWEQVWRAISCHRSQLPAYEALMNLPTEQRKRLYASQSFYRVYSLINGGRAVEHDLFAGFNE